MRAAATARGHLGDDRAEGRSEAMAIGAARSVGEVAFAVLRKNFQSFVEKEPGTRLGEDPEELHDMRVASRRMRAAIALFRNALPARALRVRDELGWVAGSLGSVRDLDVQLQQLNSWSLDPALHANALGALRDLLERERLEARAELLKVLDSPRYARLLDGAAGFLQGGPLKRSTDSRAPIVVAGAALLRRRYRSVRKVGDRIGEGATADDFHRLRIRCKRFRYALEFLADVYPHGADPLIRRLTDLQGLLGMQQDADVAVRRLRALATRENGGLPPATVFAMGVVAERYVQQGRELRARFPKAYGKVRGQPWRELRLVMKEDLPAQFATGPPAQD